MDNLIWKGFTQKPGMPKGGNWYVFQCLFCQKPFVSPGYEVNAGRMTKYCSNDCQMASPSRINNAREERRKIDSNGNNNPNYKDGATLYTKFGKTICELCGVEKKQLGTKRNRSNLLVHHLDMNRRNSDPSNLKTLCFSCHMRVHNPSNYGKYPDYQKW